MDMIHDKFQLNGDKKFPGTYLKADSSPSLFLI